MLLDKIKQLIPQLSNVVYKGCAGKVGIVGGSVEYTGAPFFAAISALRTGADLVYVFCAEEAATAIKSYSPEVIVYPTLKPSVAATAATAATAPPPPSMALDTLPRLTSLVIGPGLGRNAAVLEQVKTIIGEARKLELPLVLDGDALFLVSQQPDVIRGYEHAVLTPNGGELKRLAKSLNIYVPRREALVEAMTKHISTGENVIDRTSALCTTACAISEALGVTVVQKDLIDFVVHPTSPEVICCTLEGSRRRCGGQGDLVAGAIGAFTSFANVTDNKDKLALASFAGCLLVRKCANSAFARNGRGTITSDMVQEIPVAYASLFEDETM